MNDKISIICPTRNRWQLLYDRAIPSVFAQTYKNWEMIIVDDGSDEEWPFGAVDKRIRVFRIEKQYTYPRYNKKYEWQAGPCNAINEGLRQVTGDWIARLDDDDEYYPETLEWLLRFAKDCDYDFVSALWIGADRRVGLPDNVDGRLIGGVQTWLYRAEFKDEKADPYCWKKGLVNDIDLSRRLVERKDPALSFGFLPQVVAKILPRPGISTIGLQGYLE